MKKIAELFTKSDDWIILNLQVIYLYLLDRTGVYLATLEFALIGAGTILSFVAVPGAGYRFFLLGLLLFNGAVLGQRYLMQDKAQTKPFNMGALIMRRWVLRHALTGFLAGSIILELFMLDAIGVVNNIVGIVYIYTFLVLIRDREKKPFFETAPKLATESAS